MRTYSERLANIKAKAKQTKKAYAAIAVGTVTLSVFALLVCSVFFWPELLFRSSPAPTLGPALQDATNRNDYPMATIPMTPSTPAAIIGFETTNLKLHSGEDWGWGPLVISSVAELELFCARQSAQYDDWPEFLTKPSDTVLEHASKYDDAFFTKQSLILLMKPEGSGSNQLEVTDVFWVGDAVYVTIDRILPEVGTADMAYWYVFIETDQVLAEDTKAWVQYSINGDEWQEPAAPRNQISIRTQEIYYGAPDMEMDYPRTDVIASVDELQMYLSALEQNLSAETQQYDETFFETHTLLALWNRVGSSSEEYNVTQVWRMSDGGVSIRGEKYSPEFFNEDVMSWLIFIEAETEISHYSRITVEYETITETISPERPDDTNLEFWIGEDVADVDFSAYDEIYGWFGAREYLGNGYSMILNGDGQPTYPQTYVSYLISAFPDESDGGSYVTRIEIRDETVLVYGLTIQSDSEEFEAVFRAMGYGIYEENGTWRAKKDGITFTFRKGEHLSISVQVTNRNGIIY